MVFPPHRRRGREWYATESLRYIPPTFPIDQIKISHSILAYSHSSCLLRDGFAAANFPRSLVSARTDRVREIFTKIENLLSMPSI